MTAIPVAALHTPMSDTFVRHQTASLSDLVRVADDVSFCMGLFFGASCSRPYSVIVPVLTQAEETGLSLASVRPSVWMTPGVGVDWSQVGKNWESTYINRMPGTRTRLPDAFTVYTELTSRGDPNDVIFRLSHGTVDWIGNILVVQHSTRTKVEDFSDSNKHLIEHVLQVAIEKKVLMQLDEGLMPQETD
ncbi:hypothetical protein EXIGLDRAFT_780888 [Exidia glandulosa HHB12029]|uniref:Uncharacterized protein n=1 Tax=Exidia glandulosa HHB12029 TaxID=1314781 RepID=A0A165BF19_EXIGL|nr:hypothetical protein EXIGLDRAFT_780888 [Exidia glandulosa HHB12029]